jgi:hypothetical protein
MDDIKLGICPDLRKWLEEAPHRRELILSFTATPNTVRLIALQKPDRGGDIYTTLEPDDSLLSATGELFEQVKGIQL